MGQLPVWVLAGSGPKLEMDGKSRIVFQVMFGSETRKKINMIMLQAVELVNWVFVALFFIPTSGLSPLPVVPTSAMGFNQKWARTGNGWQEPDSIPSNVVIRTYILLTT